LSLRRTSPPVALGIVVAVALIAAETLAVYPLSHIAPEISLGVVSLLGRPSHKGAPCSTLW
jgi:hypothetical protein